MRTCAYLIDFHESKGDKILVFCDNLYCLKRYANAMQRNVICGSLKQSDRVRLLEQFKTSDEVNCLFISKVGDSAIDLPTASVIIQIASTDGSRRQEAQRLGRILRPKPSRADCTDHNAFFYTLVSRDTEEVFYAAKRQSFLIDQGYSFKVLDRGSSLSGAPGLPLSSRRAQLDLLAEILASTETDAEEAAIDWNGTDTACSAEQVSALAPIRRVGGGLAELSGGSGILYQEFDRAERIAQANKLAQHISK